MIKASSLFLARKTCALMRKLIKEVIYMITFCILVLILAIAGVVFGFCGLGFAIIFGDAIIGIALLVFIIKKLFFNKKNKDDK